MYNKVHIFSTGEVHLVYQEFVTVRCKMEIRAFPYDLQQCTQNYQVQFYDNEMIRLNATNEQSDAYFNENPGELEPNIIGTNFDKTIEKCSCSVNP